MDERLRATGRSIVLRRATLRWLEYAFVAWTLSLLVLILGAWQTWNLVTEVVTLISLGCAFAAIAAVYNVRFLEAVRQERSLTRVAGKSHSDGGPQPQQPV
jgi:hypothetical protein